MSSRTINSQSRFRERTLLEKLSDFADGMKRKTPAPTHIRPRHPFFFSSIGSQIPFAAPPSSLPLRTQQQSNELLALLPLLQAKFYDNNEREYAKLLKRMYKLDPEVCKDFETTIVLAAEVDLGRAYFSFVEKGLDERNRWQGEGVFGWMGFCSYSIITTLETLLTTLRKASQQRRSRIRWNHLEYMIEESLPYITQLDKMTGTLLARIWGEVSSFQEKRRETLRLVAHWRFAVQEKYTQSQIHLQETTSPLALSPSTTSTSTSTSASSRPSLFASLPFLTLTKSTTTNNSSIKSSYDPESPSPLGWHEGTTATPLSEWAMKRCEVASEGFEDEEEGDEVYEFGYEGLELELDGEN